MRKKRTRMGRPPKPPGEAKTKAILLKVTPREHEVLTNAAAKVGKNFSAWAREILLSQAETTDD